MWVRTITENVCYGYGQWLNVIKMLQYFINIKIHLWKKCQKKEQKIVLTFDFICGEVE